MIYYINENKYNDNIFNCIIEASSIISDIRMLPYENNEFVNESVKDTIAGFFRELIERVRRFFRKIKNFIQTKILKSQIDSFEDEFEDDFEDFSYEEENYDSMDLPNPNSIKFEESINAIQATLRKWIQDFADIRAKEQTNQEYKDSFNYNEIKDSFKDSVKVSKDEEYKTISVKFTKDGLAKYCDTIRSSARSMDSSMNKLERDIISEINNFQQSMVQNTNISFNYISTIISAALNAIQIASSEYRKKYEELIKNAREIYNDYKSDKGDSEE